MSRQRATVAKRPIKQKKLRRLRKAVERTPLPAYIDLIDWLKTRRYADTTGQAIRLLVDGKVKSESHVIGREKRVFFKDDKQHERWEPAPRVPSYMRATITVDA